MRKQIGAAAAAVALVVIVFSTAHADDHLSPGVRGTPSCRGQTTAFLAQAAKNGLLDEAVQGMGIGGIARASHFTVSDIHDLVETLCAPGLPQPPK